MKKLFFTSLFALVAAIVMAVPVQKGQWKTITLADGSKVRVEAVGDELCHYWRSAAGDAYVQQNGVFVKADAHELEEAVESKRFEIGAQRDARFEKYFGNKFGVVAKDKQRLGLKKLSGTKRGIVLLVEFSDTHFIEEHTTDFYLKVLNEGGPTERGYGKSVKQYFSDQSNDKFTVNFDVSPIIRMPNAHGKYTDNVPAMIRYAISELKSKNPNLNWDAYDWDNDGEIDMVFVLFAGYGQASKTDDETLIWPHESSFGYNKPVVGSKTVNTYACANEINWNWGDGDIDSGIGTFCHEFSHCLGYPDVYDPCYGCSEKGLSEMSYWDLLDSGSYNGDGFCPAPYSVFERWTAGWVNLVELEAGKEYNNLRPITDKDGGDVYVMTNPNNKNEFYAFEPIQNKDWASGFYKAQGLLVLHIDYADNPWNYNLVNCAKYPSINDHSRYTYVPADGSFVAEYTSQIRGDLFPYKTNNYIELEWNTGDKYGNKACPIIIRNIKLNSDNTVSYVTEKAEEPTVPEGLVYYESFNKCSGTGGNDDVWSDIAIADLQADNEWTVAVGNGARKCALFGSNTQIGIATTAAITFEPGTYVLTFKAGRYGNEVPKITLSDPSNTTTTFSQTTFELTAGQWNDCKAVITVGEKANIRFRASSKGRWFLDEVMIQKADADAIDVVTVPSAANKNAGAYNLNGQKVGAGYRGITIKNGKKFFVK